MRKRFLNNILFIMAFVSILGVSGTISSCSSGNKVKVSGKGTSEQPYLIYTTEEFKEIYSLNLEDKNAHFVLMNDIDVSGIDNFVIHSFEGVLDGRNHRIYNYEGSTGLIGVNNGTIKNLIIGGLISGEYSVSNTIGVSLTSGRTLYMGGLVDINQGNMINCGAENVRVSYHVDNQVNTDKELNVTIGGLVGVCQAGNMQYCYAKNCAISVKANICPGDTNSDGKAAARAGGVVGSVDTSSLLQSSYAYGNTVNAFARGGKTWTFTKAELRAFSGGLVGDSCSTNTKCLVAYHCDVVASVEEVGQSKAEKYPHAGAVIGVASQGGSFAYTLNTDKCNVIGKDYGSFTDVGKIENLTIALENKALTAGVAKWTIDESGNIAFDNFMHNPIQVIEE